MSKSHTRVIYHVPAYFTPFFRQRHVCGLVVKIIVEFHYRRRGEACSVIDIIPTWKALNFSTSIDFSPIYANIFYRSKYFVLFLYVLINDYRHSYNDFGHRLNQPLPLCRHTITLRQLCVPIEFK